VVRGVRLSLAARASARAVPTPRAGMRATGPLHRRRRICTGGECNEKRTRKCPRVAASTWATRNRTAPDRSDEVDTRPWRPTALADPGKRVRAAQKTRSDAMRAIHWDMQDELRECRNHAEPPARACSGDPSAGIPGRCPPHAHDCEIPARRLGVGPRRADAAVCNQKLMSAGCRPPEQSLQRSWTRPRGLSRRGRARSGSARAQ